MAEYRYNAKDAAGRRVTGHIEAATAEQAIHALASDGLACEPGDLEMLDSGSRTATARPLSRGETSQLVESVVDLAASGLPLSAGLRAASEEIPQRRVASAMRRIALELDRGVSIDAALESANDAVPSHLRGLILAGLRTGRLAHVLEELVTIDRDQLELRRRIVAALAYPTILFVVVIGFFVLAQMYIVRPFMALFEEFGMELPTITLLMANSVMWFDSWGAWYLLVFAGVVAPAFVLLLVAPKPPRLQRVCYRFPILGPLWKSQSLVDFSRLMQLLLERQMPLGDALRLTADGLRWSDLAVVSRSCAMDVDGGMELPEAMARYREFPPTMRPVIESGMKTQDPSSAFAAAANMYRSRAGVDATLWEAILPPLLLVFIAFSVGFLVIAMMLPMIKLVSCLV